ncbi:Tubulin-specific chaperone D [Portunus trituberculatus]|uniref:Tubulin-specific chaperone D n=1 Tax=Portunus trituberculatus TaxID=210409 RepID=A0A5B7GSB6_PORTR|nr:Tubulin-specific chaperone D [Portunus trituberculatus]
MDGIVKIVPILEERKLLRGLDGEYMKQATAVLIEKCSLAALPLHHHEILKVWHQLLEECIVVIEENIRLAALQALVSLWTTYFQPVSQAGFMWRDDLVNRYTASLNTDKEIQRQGFSAALEKRLEIVKRHEGRQGVNFIARTLQLPQSTVSSITKQAGEAMA